jgi:hypothetical protein
MEQNITISESTLAMFEDAANTLEQAITAYEIADEKLDGESRRTIQGTAFTLFLIANNKMTTILSRIYQAQKEAVQQ